MTWRVHYDLWVAGGRLWPTFWDVEADTPEDALEEAKRRQRDEDRREGHRDLGYWERARVESKEAA